MSTRSVLERYREVCVNDLETNIIYIRTAGNESKGGVGQGRVKQNKQVKLWQNQQFFLVSK